MSLSSRILAAVLIGLGLFLGGYFTGKSNEHNADDAKKGKALETAVEKHDEAEAVGQEVERQSAVRSAKTEAIFNGIQQGVITYAQTHRPDDCGLDADGMRIWRAANDGADFETSSGGQGGVPSATAAEEQQPNGSTGEPRSSGQAVPPVPGPASSAGQLDGEN